MQFEKSMTSRENRIVTRIIDQKFIHGVFVWTMQSLVEKSFRETDT